MTKTILTGPSDLSTSKDRVEWIRSARQFIKDEGWADGNSPAEAAIDDLLKYVDQLEGCLEAIRAEAFTGSTSWDGTETGDIFNRIEQMAISRSCSTPEGDNTDSN